MLSHELRLCFRTVNAGRVSRASQVVSWTERVDCVWSQSFGVSHWILFRNLQSCAILYIGRVNEILEEIDDFLCQLVLAEMLLAAVCTGTDAFRWAEPMSGQLFKF